MISPRELRLLFWLIVIALVGVIGILTSGIADTLTGPAVILFIAWLMAYVLEPAVDWLARHLPFHSRALAVAVTYLVTVLVTFAVLLGAGAALLSAAVTFVEQLPTIVARVRELAAPLAESLGLTPPARSTSPARSQARWPRTGKPSPMPSGRRSRTSSRSSPGSSRPS